MTFHRKDEEENREFTTKMRISCRYIFLLIVGIMLVAFLIYRFSAVRSGLSKIESYLRGILYGLGFAYVISPFCDWIEKGFRKLLKNKKNARRAAKGWGIGLGVACSVAAVIALLVVVIPSLINSISNLVEQIPGYVTNVQNFIQDYSAQHQETAAQLGQVLDKAASAIGDWVQNQLGTFAENAISTLTSGVIDVARLVINSLIGIIICVYVLRDKQSIKNRIKKMVYADFTGERADEILDTLRHGNRIFGGFIHGKLLDSILIGLICFVGTTILRIPYAGLISVIVGVTNIIPFFGPFIGAIPSAILIVAISPIKCLWFIIFIIVLQQFDGNWLGPKILGSTTGINEFWVMFALLLFGGIFKAFGMIIGVPLFAVIYYIVVRRMNKRLSRKGLPEDSAAYQKVAKYSDLTEADAALETPDVQTEKEGE